MFRKITTAAALAAVALAIPASASAESFGSKLTPNIQPSNAGVKGHPCVQGDPGACTRVMMEGYTNGSGVGSPKAPHDGTIDKLKIIAQGPGKFRPALAKAKPNAEQARLTYRGSQIEYDGQQGGGMDYDIETFDVEHPGRQGRVPRDRVPQDLIPALLLRRCEPAPLPARAGPGWPVRARHGHRRLLAAPGSGLRVASTSGPERA